MKVFFTTLAILHCFFLSAQEKQEEFNKYINDFKKAVIMHDVDKTIDLLDDTYVEEQLENMLQGNKTQFLNELFCGRMVSNRDFKCAIFDKIESIKLVETKKTGDGEITVKIEINTNTETIVHDLFVKRVKNGKYKYAIIGALG